MSTTCIYCHKDQGRRTCPALNGLISTTCCGKHRGVRISCPASCKYFKEHEEYQRARLGKDFQAAWLDATAPIYQKQQAELFNWLVFLEITIYQYFLSQTRGTDSDILEALAFLKHKLSPITIIETTGSGLANHLWEACQPYLEANSELDQEVAKEGVDVLSALLQKSKNGAEPRQGLHGLLGHVENFIGVPKELAATEKPAIDAARKIILPGS